MTVLAPTPAQAGWDTLCYGYSSCQSKGYSHSGYAQASGKMYWRMYSGHNCTNYVAYRMVKAGMPNVRPWSGSGMAYNWGIAMADKTNQTPTVGSVAWFKRNTSGVGSSGHVAYVEKVISPTEILVSEDSWNGDFDWRRITKDSGYWPSGFIHFVDKQISNTAPPAISGTPAVGQPLQASKGTWKNAPTGYSYQWFAGASAIAGATKATFTPTAAQAGMRLRVKVTAKRNGYTAGQATSAPSGVVAKQAFTVATPTTIAGEPVAGQTLTLTRATFTPQPEKTTTQWRADGVVVPKNTSPRLVLDQSMVGKTITATTIAKGAGFKDTGSKSAATAPVYAAAASVDRPFQVVGTPKVGQTVQVQGGAIRPVDATVAHQWLRDGAPIPGATGPSYRLTPSDMGGRISVQSTVTKPGYAPGVGTATLAGTVKDVPNVQVIGRSGKGTAILSIRVTAAGDAYPDGKLKVRVSGRHRTVALVDGQAKVEVKVKQGNRGAKVTFTGNESLLRAVGRTKVFVSAKDVNQARPAQ